MKTKNHDFINICGEWINLNEVRKICTTQDTVIIRFIDNTIYEICSTKEEVEISNKALDKKLTKLM